MEKTPFKERIEEIRALLIEIGKLRELEAKMLYKVFRFIEEFK